ncbi:MAG: hypothetical protein AAF962_03310 [Actinomycetota bacterium]
MASGGRWRGRLADAAEAPPGDTLTLLSWEPVPGYLVGLLLGLEREAAIDFAEGLRSADSVTWEEYWAGDRS